MKGKFFTAVIFLLICALLIPIESFAQTAKDIQLGKKWKLAPSITIPPLMLRESPEENVGFDVVFTASIGGGIAFKYCEIDPVTGESDSQFSWSPFTILISGDTKSETPDLSVAYAMTVGFFDDLIQTGFGYDFGDNRITNDDGAEVTISRWFFLLGLGFSFGNS